MTDETALAKEATDIQAVNWHHEGIKLLEYAESRVITSVEDVKLANDDLSVISRLKKAMEERRKERLQPYRDAQEAINTNYKSWMAPVLEADKITREKMLAYAAEQKRIRAEQEEINRKRQEAAEAEMKLKGELSEPVNLVPVDEAPKRVITNMGTSGLVDCWKYEVVDFALLPDEFKVADRSMLNSVAKGHHDKKPVPGVRFYNEPYLATRPR